MTTLGYLRSVREYMYPQRTTTAYLEKGVLTPEEFVRTGDELVFKCPTWSWESGDPKKLKSFLPVDKQFLITRNVPCQNRVSTMENTLAIENMDEDEGDWLVSHVVKQENSDIEEEFDIIDGEGQVMEKVTIQEDLIDDNEEEYTDMADFEDENVLKDDAAVSPIVHDAGGNLMKVRTYDLSITYDKYYQTPRVWIMGYTAESQPLTGEEMFQDVISDYANRTVTIENHPHVAGPHASIHPCQHGKVMKAIVKNLMKDCADIDDGPPVENYLFIFLKFVSSIIPTINYDFTMEVTANTSK